MGKVGLAALQDIAARQEAALLGLQQDDVTPTNGEGGAVGHAEAKYDVDNNKMMNRGSELRYFVVVSFISLNWLCFMLQC